MNDILKQTLRDNSPELLNQVKRYQALRYSPLEARLRISMLKANGLDVEEDLKKQEERGSLYFKDPVRIFANRLIEISEEGKNKGSAIRFDIDQETGQLKDIIDFNELSDINSNASDRLIDFAKNKLADKIFQEKYKENKEGRILALSEVQNKSRNELISFLHSNYNIFEKDIENIVLDEINKQAKERFEHKLRLKALTDASLGIPPFSSPFLINTGLNFFDSFLDVVGLKETYQRANPNWFPSSSDLDKTFGTLTFLVSKGTDEKLVNEAVKYYENISKPSETFKDYVNNELAEGVGRSLGFFAGAAIDIFLMKKGLGVVSKVPGLFRLGRYIQKIDELKKAQKLRPAFGELYATLRETGKSVIPSLLFASARHFPTYLRRAGISLMESPFLIPKGIQNYLDQVEENKDFIYDIFLEYQLETLTEQLLLEGRPLAKGLIAPISNNLYNAAVNVFTEEFTNIAQDIFKGTDTSIFTPSSDDKTFFEKFRPQIDAAAISSAMSIFGLSLGAVGNSYKYSKLLLTDPRRQKEFFKDVLQIGKYRSLAKNSAIMKLELGIPQSKYGVQVFDTFWGVSDKDIGELNKTLLDSELNEETKAKLEEQINTEVEKLEVNFNKEKNGVESRIIQGFAKLKTLNDLSGGKLFSNDELKEIEEFLFTDIQKEDYEKIDKIRNKATIDESYIDNKNQQLKITGNERIDRELSRIFFLDYAANNFDLNENNTDNYKLSNEVLERLTADIKDQDKREKAKKDINTNYNKFIQSSVGKEVNLEASGLVDVQKEIREYLGRALRVNIGRSLDKLSSREIIRKGKKVLEEINSEVKEKDKLLTGFKTEYNKMVDRLKRSKIWNNYEDIVNFIIVANKKLTEEEYDDAELERLKYEAVNLIKTFEKYHFRYEGFTKRIDEVSFSSALRNRVEKIKERFKDLKDEERAKVVKQIFDGYKEQTKDDIKDYLYSFLISLVSGKKIYEMKEEEIDKLKENIYKTISDIVDKKIKLYEEAKTSGEARRVIRELKGDIISVFNTKEFIELLKDKKYLSYDKFNSYINDRLDFIFYQYSEYSKAYFDALEKEEKKKTGGLSEKTSEMLLSALGGGSTQTKTESEEVYEVISKEEGGGIDTTPIKIEKVKVDKETGKLLAEIERILTLEKPFSEKVEELKKLLTKENLELIKNYISSAIENQMKYYEKIENNIPQKNSIIKISSVINNKNLFNILLLLTMANNDIEEVNYIIDKIGIDVNEAEVKDRYTKMLSSIADAINTVLNSSMIPLNKLRLIIDLLYLKRYIFFGYTNFSRENVKLELTDEFVKDGKYSFKFSFIDKAGKSYNGTANLLFIFGQLNIELVFESEGKTISQTFVIDELTEVLRRGKEKGLKYLIENKEKQIKTKIENVKSIPMVEEMDIEALVKAEEAKGKQDLENYKKEITEFINILFPDEKTKSYNAFLEPFIEYIRGLNGFPYVFNISKEVTLKHKKEEIKKEVENYIKKENKNIVDVLSIIDALNKITLDEETTSKQIFDGFSNHIRSVLLTILFNLMPPNNDKVFSSVDGLKDILGFRSKRETEEKQTTEVKEESAVEKKVQQEKVPVQKKKSELQEEPIENLNKIEVSEKDENSISQTIEISNDAKENIPVSENRIEGIDLDTPILLFPSSFIPQAIRYGVAEEIFNMTIHEREKELREVMNELVEYHLKNKKLKELSFYKKIMKKAKNVEGIELSEEEKKAFINYYIGLLLGNKNIIDYVDLTKLVKDERIRTEVLNKEKELIEAIKNRLIDLVKEKNSKKGISFTDTIKYAISKVMGENYLEENKEYTDNILLLVRLIALKELRKPTKFVMPFHLNQELRKIEDSVINDPKKLNNKMIVFEDKYGTKKKYYANRISTVIRMAIGWDRPEDNLLYLIGFDLDLKLSSGSVEYLELSPLSFVAFFKNLLQEYKKYLIENKEEYEYFLEVLNNIYRFLRGTGKDRSNIQFSQPLITELGEFLIKEKGQDFIEAEPEQPNKGKDRTKINTLEDEINGIFEEYKDIAETLKIKLEIDKEREGEDISWYDESKNVIVINYKPLAKKIAYVSTDEQLSEKNKGYIIKTITHELSHALISRIDKQVLDRYYKYYRQLGNILIELNDILKIEEVENREKLLNNFVKEYFNDKLSVKDAIAWLLQGETPRNITNLIEHLKGLSDYKLLQELSAYMVSDISDTLSVLLYLLKPIKIDEIEKNKERLEVARYTDNLLNQYRLVYIQNIVSAVTHFKNSNEIEELRGENLLSQLNRIVSGMSLAFTSNVITADQEVKNITTVPPDKEEVPSELVSKEDVGEQNQVVEEGINQITEEGSNNEKEHHFPSLYSEVFNSGREINLNLSQLRSLIKELQIIYPDKYKTVKDLLTKVKSVEEFINLFLSSEEVKSHLAAIKFYEGATGKDLVDSIFYKLVEMVQKLNSISYYPMVNIIIKENGKVYIEHKSENEKNSKGTRISNYSNTILLKKWEKEINNELVQLIEELTDYKVEEKDNFLTIGQINEILVESSGGKREEAHSRDIRGKIKRMAMAFQKVNKVFLGFFADKNTIPFLDFGSGYKGKMNYLKASLLAIKIYRRYKELFNYADKEGVFSDEELDKMEYTIKKILDFNFVRIQGVIGEFQSNFSGRSVRIEEIEEFVQDKNDSFKLIAEYLRKHLEENNLEFIRSGDIANLSTAAVYRYYRMKNNISISDIYQSAVTTSIAFRTLMEDLKLGLPNIKFLLKNGTKLESGQGFIKLVKRHTLASQIYNTNITKPIIDLINGEHLDSSSWKNLVTKSAIEKRLDETVEEIAEEENITSEEGKKELREKLRKLYLSPVYYRTDFKLTDNTSESVYYEEKNSEYDIKFRHVFMDSTGLENYLGISRIDGAVFILPEAAHVLLTAQGGAYYSGIKNFVYIKEKGVYSKHAMFIVPDNDPMAEMMRKRKISIVFTKEAEKNNAKVQYYSREQLMGEGSVNTDVVSIKDFHRIKEGSSESEEVRGLSQLINTTQLLSNKNTTVSEEDRKVLQKFFAQFMEQIIKRNFLDSEYKIALKFAKKVMSVYTSPSSYSMEVVKFIVRAVLLNNGIRHIDQLLEYRKDKQKFINLVNNIIDDLSAFKGVVPISSTFGFFIRQPLKDTVKLSSEGFSGVLYPDIFDSIKDATVVRQFINILKIIDDKKGLPGEADEKLVQYFVDKGIVTLNENNELLLTEKYKKILDNFLYVENKVYAKLEDFDNSAESIKAKILYRHYNTKLLDNYNKLQSIMKNELNELYSQIEKLYFDDQGKIKDGNILISMEQAANLNLGIGDSLLSFIMPTDSPMSSTGVRVRGIMPEGIMPLGTMSLNSEYAQGLGGRDFDIDVMYVINKPEKVTYSDWKRVVDIFKNIPRAYYMKMYDTMLNYFRSYININKDITEPEATPTEIANIERLSERISVKVDRYLNFDNINSIEDLQNQINNFKDEDIDSFEGEVAEIQNEFKHILEEKNSKRYKRLKDLVSLVKLRNMIMRLNDVNQVEEFNNAVKDLGFNLEFNYVETREIQGKTSDVFELSIKGEGLSLKKQFWFDKRDKLILGNKELNQEEIKNLDLPQAILAYKANVYISSKILKEAKEKLNRLIHEESEIIREHYTKRLQEMKKEMLQKVKKAVEEQERLIKEGKLNKYEKMKFMSSKEMRLLFMQLYFGINPEFSDKYEVLTDSTLKVYEMFYKEIGLIIIARELFSLYSIIEHKTQDGTRIFAGNFTEEDWLMKHYALLVLTNDFVDFPTNDNKTYYISDVDYVFNRIFEIKDKEGNYLSKFYFDTVKSSGISKVYNIPRMQKPVYVDKSSRASYFYNTEISNVLKIINDIYSYLSSLSTEKREELMTQIPLFRLVYLLKNKNESGTNLFTLLANKISKLFYLSKDKIEGSFDNIRKKVFTAEYKSILKLYDNETEKNPYSVPLVLKAFDLVSNYFIELSKAYLEGTAGKDKRNVNLGLVNNELLGIGNNPNSPDIQIDDLLVEEILKEFKGIIPDPDILLNHIKRFLNFKTFAENIINQIPFLDPTNTKKEEKQTLTEGDIETIKNIVAVKIFQIAPELIGINMFLEKYKGTEEIKKMNSKDINDLITIYRDIAAGFRNIVYVSFKPSGSLISNFDSMSKVMISGIVKEYLIRTLDAIANSTDIGAETLVSTGVFNSIFSKANNVKLSFYSDQSPFLVYNMTMEEKRDLVDVLVFDRRNRNLYYIENVSTFKLNDLVGKGKNVPEIESIFPIKEKVDISKWRENEKIRSLVENVDKYVNYVSKSYSPKIILDAIYKSVADIDNISDMEKINLVEEILHSYIQDILNNNITNKLKAVTQRLYERDIEELRLNKSDLIKLMVSSIASLGGFAGEVTKGKVTRVSGPETSVVFGYNLYTIETTDNIRYLATLSVLTDRLNRAVKNYISRNYPDSSLLQKYLDSHAINIYINEFKEQIKEENTISSEELKLFMPDIQVEEKTEYKINTTKSSYTSEFRKKLLNLVKEETKDIDKKLAIVNNARGEVIELVEEVYEGLKEKEERILEDDIINKKSVIEYIDKQFDTLVRYLEDPTRYSNTAIRRHIYKIVSMYNSIDNIRRRKGEMGLIARLLKNSPFRILVDTQFNLTLFGRVFSAKLFPAGVDLPQIISGTFRHLGSGASETFDLDKKFKTSTIDISASFGVASSGEEFKGVNLSLIDVFFYKLSELNNTLSYYKETSLIAINRALYPLRNLSVKEYKEKTNLLYELIDKINRLPQLLSVSSLEPNGTFKHRIYIADLESEQKLVKPVSYNTKLNALQQFELYLDFLETYIYLRENGWNTEEFGKKALKKLEEQNPEIFNWLTEEERLLFINAVKTIFNNITNLQQLKKLVADVRYLLEKTGSEKKNFVEAAILLKYVNFETSGLVKSIISFIDKKIEDYLEIEGYSEKVDKLMQIKSKYINILYKKLYGSKSDFGGMTYYTYVPKVFTKETLINAVGTSRAELLRGKFTGNRLDVEEQIETTRRKIISELRDKFRDEVFASDLLYNVTYFIPGSEIKNIQQSYLAMVNDLTSTLKKDIIGIYLDEYKKLSSRYEDSYTKEKFMKFLRREAGYSIFEKNVFDPDEISENTFIGFYVNKVEEVYLNKEQLIKAKETVFYGKLPEEVEEKISDEKKKKEIQKGTKVKLLTPKLINGKLVSYSNGTITLDRNGVLEKYKIEDIYSIEDDGTRLDGKVTVIRMEQQRIKNPLLIKLRKFGGLLLDAYITMIRGLLNIMKSKANQWIGTPLKMAETRPSYIREFTASYRGGGKTKEVMGQLDTSDELPEYQERLRTLSQISDNLLVDVYYGGSRKIDPDKLFDYMYSEEGVTITNKYKNEAKILYNVIKLWRMTRNENYIRLIKRLSDLDEIITKYRIEGKSQKEVEKLIALRNHIIVDLVREEADIVAEIESLNLSEYGKDAQAIGDIVTDMMNAIGALRDKYKSDVIYFIGLTPGQTENILYKYLRDFLVNNRLKYINDVEGKIRETTFRVRFNVYYLKSKNFTEDEKSDFDNAIRYAARGVVIDHALYDNLNRPISDQTWSKAINTLRQYTFNRFVNTILLFREFKEMAKIFGISELIKDVFRKENKKMLIENPLQLIVNQLMVNSILYTLSFIVPTLRWYMNPFYLIIANLVELFYFLPEGDGDDEEKKRRQKAERFATIGLLSPFTGFLGSMSILLALDIYKTDKEELKDYLIQNYIYTGSIGVGKKFIELIDLILDEDKSTLPKQLSTINFLLQTITGIYIRFDKQFDKAVEKVGR